MFSKRPKWQENLTCRIEESRVSMPFGILACTCFEQVNRDVVNYVLVIQLHILLVKTGEFTTRATERWL